MAVEHVRISQDARDKLIKLKRVTGIKNWNVLCRWGLCASLAETSRWTAILGIAVQPPTNADALRTNPLGIFVTSINWSKELG